MSVFAREVGHLHASTRALSPPVHQSSLSQALALPHRDLPGGDLHAEGVAQARARVHLEGVFPGGGGDGELRLDVREVGVDDLARVLRALGVHEHDILVGLGDVHALPHPVE